MNQVARKICATCGRQISWRKKWEKNWSTITYCSNTCRSNKIRPNSLDTSFESKILSALAERRKLHGVAAVVTCEEVEAAVQSEREDVTDSSETYQGKEREKDIDGDRDSDRERDITTNHPKEASEPDSDPPTNRTSNSTPNNVRSTPRQHGKGTSNSNSSSSSNSNYSKDVDKDQTNTQANSRTRERCRQAARRLAERGEIQITQRGKVTDPSFTKGVMELKLPE